MARFQECKAVFWPFAQFLAERKLGQEFKNIWDENGMCDLKWSLGEFGLKRGQVISPNWIICALMRLDSCLQLKIASKLKD